MSYVALQMTYVFIRSSIAEVQRLRIDMLNLSLKDQVPLKMKQLLLLKDLLVAMDIYLRNAHINDPRGSAPKLASAILVRSFEFLDNIAEFRQKYADVVESDDKTRLFDAFDTVTVEICRTADSMRSFLNEIELE